MHVPPPDNENETARPETLGHYEILDMPPEEVFDDLTRLAAYICGTPIALINPIGTGQHWFKAKEGLDASGMPWWAAFCSLVMLQSDLVIIPDTLEDARCAISPALISEPQIRFYAGVPLITPEGQALGILCVADYVPRQLSAEQVEALRMVARQAVTRLELRRTFAERIQVEEALRASEERLRFALESARVGTWEWDIRTGKSSWSDQLERLHGFTPGTYGGTYDHFLASVHSDDREYVREAVAHAVETGMDYDIEFRITWPDGSIHWMARKGRAICDETGRAIRMVGIGMDITERRQAQEALRSSEERLARIVETNADGIAIVDRDGYITFANAAAEQILGLTRNDIIGRAYNDPAWKIVAADGSPFSEEDLLFARVMRSGEPIYGVELAIEHPGKSVILSINTAPLRDAEGGIIGVVVSFSDITERKQAEQQRLRYALHDTLTDLPNRILFMDRLGYAVECAKCHAEYKFAVLFMDLDRFKVVNDNLGHIIGDRLLVAIARRLEACVRTEDTIARLGGDEFVILLDGITETCDAIHVADRIQEALRRPFELGGHQVLAMASIGITLSTTGYERPDDVLRDADIAMYRAKISGKARYEVVDAAMHAYITARTQLEADLQQAVERQEFQLQYQPVVSLPTHTIIGVEALLRWQHPQRGLISPVEFISLAEESGLIVSIGEWVLRTACRQVNAWRTAGLPQLWVSVNLSARQFRQKNVSSMIADILEETRLAPECLTLEITESSVMEDAETTVTLLQQLKALGVNLSIDDFGTGYSSLHYLQRFPLDTLKIARSFVQNIATDPNDAAITTAIIAMARSLGLSIIAEGMETCEQLAFLSAHQCDAIQGYLFSQPMSAEALTILLEQGHSLVTKAWEHTEP